MLNEYLNAALHRAHYEIIAEDRSYYGEIPGFDGLYANADNLEDCREELRQSLEDWMFFRISKQLPLPVIDGLELAIKELA